MRTTVLTVSAVAALGLALLPGVASAKLVYRCGANLCQANDDGSNQKQLTTDGDAKTGSFFGPDLSADGTKLSFFRQDSEARGAFVIDLTTNTRTTIGTGTPDDVQMRPDGQRLAVDEFGDSETAPSKLCYYNASGGGRVCEVPGQGGSNAFGQDYRPDGRLISLVPTGDQARHSKICLRVADGSGQSGCEADLVVDNSRYFGDPAVSPDGKSVAVTLFAGPDESLGAIGIYDLTSGTFLRQVSAGAQDNDPAWTGDSKHVIFARGRNTDSPSLWSVSASGPSGSEEKIVDGGLEPTASLPVTVGAAASGLKVKGSQKGTAVKAGVQVGFDDSTVVARLTAPSKSLKAVAAAKSVVVGKLTRKGVDSGRVSLKVKLNSRGRKALAKRRRLRLKLSVTVTAGSGQKKTVSKSVVLKK